MPKFAVRFRNWITLFAFIAGIVVVLAGNKMMVYTSTDEYCMSCHIHPHADESWKKSPHANTRSGVQVHCVDCHLPPKGSFHHLWAKGTSGFKDLWSYHTKDSASFDWEKRSQLDYAVKIVYNESCLNCHQNLYPKGLSSEGALAHLYYEENEKALDLQCISCHLDVGHFNPNYKHARNLNMGNTEVKEDLPIFDSATTLTGFGDFTEQVPGTSVSFKMKALPKGSFAMGDSKSKYAKEDEKPVRQVSIDPFYMGELEVSWTEYLAFFYETRSEGRVDPQIVMAKNREMIDGVTGPTPPYGSPDQAWGYGAYPAITMSHYAATTYCQWLSLKTGKKYRLPTEAEWEYAARAGTTDDYFFGGEAKKYTSLGWWNRTFGADTSVINQYAVYDLNANGRTYNIPKLANAFGLRNMLGNVMEYCSDWYAPDAYTQTDATVHAPQGPKEGEERVVRGGSFKSDAVDLRSAARSATQTKEWLKTDPQSPKSIWWLSDCNSIGFRVVCEAN